MKRGLALFLILTILLTALPLALAADPAELQATWKIGDCNGDGIVNAKDVTVLRRCLAGGYNITVDARVGDVSGDGVMNAKDVTVLRRYLAGGYGIAEPGTVSDDPAHVYQGAVTGGKLYEDLGAPTFGAGAYQLKVTVDGVEKSDEAAAACAAKIVEGGTEAVTVDGSCTKVYVDESKKIILLVTDVLFQDGTSHAATTLSFNDAEKYRLLGRGRQGADCVYVDWSADGLEFTADCRGDLYLTASTTNSSGSPFAVHAIVDGEPGDRVIYRQGTSKQLVYTNILPGVHTVRIIKDAALGGTTDKFLSLEFSADAASIRPTQPKSRLIEVIGDSITCGYGILPTENMSATTGTASAILTFGYRVAEALDADYRILGKGSIGFVVQTGSPSYNMLELYDYQNRYRDGSTLADMSRKADLILIPLGVNDGTRTDDLEAAVREFIAKLRGIHGENVPIVLMYDLMNPRIEWLYQKLSAEMENTYVLHMTQNREGAGNHPNLVGHNQFTRETLEFLKAKGLD